MTLVSACLIVKNEERFLPGCLASLAGVADELVVVDTGSTDRTVAIAEAHGARVLHHPWSGDFAAARNVGLDHAKGRFILYVDADEEVMADDRAALRRALESDAHDAVLMRIVSPLHGSDKTSVDVYPRAFRSYPDVRFQYRIHEQIWPSLSRHAPRVFDSPLRILHHGYAQSPTILDEKRRRNLATALAVLEEEPESGFYLYQAGFACLTLGRRDEAIGWLERALRCTPPGRPRVPILNALAQVHYDARDVERARPLLDESIALASEQFHAYGLLADLHFHLKDHAAAIVPLERCLAVTRSAIPSDVAPARPVLQLKLGLARLVTQRFADAEHALESALAGGLDDDQRATAARYLELARRMRATRPNTP
jgi:tetratricopeptide (TPR) repeat protein